MRLSKALDDPTATADKLANVIRSDPALTARVLKVANSASLGHTRNIETISQAVVVIGTTRLRHVALAASVFGVFRGIPAQLLDMQSFWKHSIAVGLAAEGIGGSPYGPGTLTGPDGSRQPSEVELATARNLGKRLAHVAGHLKELRSGAAHRQAHGLS